MESINLPGPDTVFSWGSPGTGFSYRVSGFSRSWQLSHEPFYEVLLFFLEY